MKMNRNNTGRNKLLNQKILLIFTVLILSFAVITLVYGSQFVVYSQSDFDAGYSATWNNISRTSNSGSGWLRGDGDTPVPPPLIHHASVQPEKVLPGDVMTVTAEVSDLSPSGIQSVDADSLTIINVQSYPTVGENWTVRFKTIGKANLTITPVNNTYFDIDIQFSELRCGDKIVHPAYNGTSVFYADWNCSESETGYFIVSVLKAGKHTLEFRFGDDVAYAHNSPGPGWYNANWNYRKNITIDHTKVNGTQANFPVLINLTDADLHDDAQNNGDDILFTSSDGTTKLNHEIELFNQTYNATHAHLVAWVNVTSLSNTTDTVLYMYYNNSAATNQQNPTGVWDSNYQMVLHLNETSGTHYDATLNGNDGTPQGGVTQDSTGKIDGADSFDGSDDTINITNDASLNFGAGQSFTIEMWTKWETLSATRAMYRSAGSGKRWLLERRENDLARFEVHDGSSGEYVVSTTTLEDGQFHHIVGVRDGISGVLTLYVDGNSEGTPSGTYIGSVSNNEHYFIASRSGGAAFFKGIIDEVRISSTAKSAGWINSSYNNQHSPSTFYSVGGEEHVPVTITFISQYPAAISWENSTGPFNVTWLITTGTDGLNNSSVSLVWTLWDSVKEDYVWSYRVPSNNKSAVCPYCGELILRADNRNGTLRRLNFEDNDTITEGNVWKWAGGDENTTRLTIQKINSTHSYVHWNGTIEDTVFPNMHYLDRTRLQREHSKYHNISKNDTALIKFWDIGSIKGITDYKLHMFFEATTQGTPTNSLEVYYLNESYVINGNTLPHEDSTNATYMTSYNATTVVNYTYTPYNSSFVRFSINVSNGMIGTVNTTPHGYIYFKSQTEESNAYRLAYVNDTSGKNISFAETDVAWTSSNNGATFAQAEWTPKIEIHSCDGQQHQMKLYAADTSDNWGNSTLLTNDIEDVKYPPTTPNINHFHYLCVDDYDMDGTYTGTFEIGIGVATDPDGGNVTHNLTLHYGNRTFVAIVNNTFNDTDITHNGIYADISFDSTPYSSVPNYTLRCVATDDEGKTSETWLDVNFTLDHQSPTITIDVPTNESPVYRKGGEQFWVNFTYTEENPKNYTVTIYNSTATINSSSNTIYTPNSYVNVSFYMNTSAADGWYNVSVEMYDNASNYNISYQNDSVVKDTTSPGNVTGFSAIAGDGQVSLSWLNPGDSDFVGTKVIRKQGSYPVTVSDGTEVCNRTTSPGSMDSYTDTGLTNGITYYYTAFAYDKVPNYSSAVDSAQDCATPTAPAPPPVPVPEFNVIGLLALIGILSVVLAFATLRRKK